MPPFTLAASAEVMPTMGAIPIFAEVEADSFNLDPHKLEAALDAGKAANIDVVGIIGVGLAANRPIIMTFAHLRTTMICGLSTMASWAQMAWSPSWPTCRCDMHQLFPAKPLGAYGDGGAVFTDIGKIADIIKSCRVHGMGKDKYENIRFK